ncbi:urea ABC transporter permease subunit UrtB [Phyllobacterium brassicacearum]|uniref:Urea ABC transporter permease subunit UrtB n=1 Tax=Phyllobacterium brassicacearum TaxID=314235 RepID=A0A2P7BWG3_9HYPH|nr:urea ABC transporter permease subunit UrtB [Phyllobacterium brassicacearum]PSH70792.1 urea ABC transporter permease subunit UrtB [Phyllobacterium brassicacearum]TDQ35719.1 amino acid/amide ABC transporter membrane protein 1 (HAAT family) [Phyllobacterium brassicacearum]
MQFIRLLSALVLMLGIFHHTVEAHAQTVDEATLRPLVQALAGDNFDDTTKAISDLVRTGDTRVSALLNALGAGDLYVSKADKSVFLGKREGTDYVATDPVTGAKLAPVPRSAAEKIKVNNRLRREIAAAIGGLTLMSENAGERRSAAEAILKTRDPESIPLLDQAIAAEKDPGIKALMSQAKAAAILNSDVPDAEKIAAITEVSAGNGRDALGLLTPLEGAEGPVGEAARSAISSINSELAVWNAVQNIVYGLSLGSVLLLAAIGLAITFGVMGVINMAHGEMVMIGAYTTFVVQQVIRATAPGIFDYSLLIALPAAFLVSGGVGVLIERSVIRFLYGRPLETLLATWGISLVLQQAIRSWFGASNVQVGNPSWMAGSFELGLLTLTWSRLWIIVFALSVFAILQLVLKKTMLGLRMRAVTQNRRMASSMGIRTPWVDALTFGLGSGIAGIAGVALSQIDNVSPNLGQGYIIDSFMVVVFGGVGNLWGTLVGAMSLGIANKFLEPFAGAVLGKILVLVLIILFIQKRPRGLFALKGRAIEA